MPSARIPLVLPVRFSFGGTAVQTTSHEVSADGIGVRCLEPPVPGTQVSLRVYLPGSREPAQLNATVRQLRSGPESGFWAEFDGASPSRERIAAAVAAHEGSAARAPVPLGALFPRRHESTNPGLANSSAGVAKISSAGAARTSSAGVQPAAIDSPSAALASSPGAGAAFTSSPGGAMSDDTQNRRSFPRHRSRFVVRFDSVQEFVLQYAANISAGGVFVATEFPPAMDSVISVTLELPGQPQPVTARAQVVHRVTPEEAAKDGGEAGAGVQFIDADDAFREGIDRAIEAILGKGKR